MDKITAKALGESIEHWERMHGFNRVEQFKSEPPLGNYCALCKACPGVFCNGCPINNDTGASCRYTPYLSALTEYTNLVDGVAPRNWKPWRKAAQAEIDYLKSLRDV